MNLSTVLRRFAFLRQLNRKMQYSEVLKEYESAPASHLPDQAEYLHALSQIAVREILLQRSAPGSTLGLSQAEPLHVEFAGKKETADKKTAYRWYAAAGNALFMFICSYLAIRVYNQVAGQLPTKPIAPETVSTKFSDVQGMAEAKEELQEVVDYLRDGKKYQGRGVNLPRGVLLTGDPGTGKTLLARAIAGEAGVNFYYSSGSEFEEIYVGLGAKRIRELFKEAKTHSPAVIFIDELDSVGGTRKNDQYAASRQSLNQLLVEMDGFDRTDNVVVIAATNLPEILDSALRRAGRFDKEVHIAAPDIVGREAILKIYLNRVKIDETVNAGYLAKITTGTTGADLANFVNTAALHAVKVGRTACHLSDFEFALDRLFAGIENRTLQSPEEKKSTAIHEMGHLLSALLTPGSLQLHKVTILSRGRALGYTTFFPRERFWPTTRKRVIADFDVSMGGHVAEEMVFGKGQNNTGCTQDMQSSTASAYEHVKGGMFPEYTGFVNTKRTRRDLRGEYEDQVDDAVKDLLAQSGSRTAEKLKSHRALLLALADKLVEKETMNAQEVRVCIEEFYRDSPEALKAFVAFKT